jgi:hypothetical protein
MREAERLHVPVPGLKVVYGMLKTLQWKTKEAKGLVTLPLKEDPTRAILHMELGLAVPA